MEVHLTVLVGVAFTAITIARILEFEAHVVDQQFLSADAETLDVPHEFDRAFKSAGGGEFGDINRHRTQGRRPRGAIEGTKVKEVGKADHTPVDFHDIYATAFPVIKLGADRMSVTRSGRIKFHGDVIRVHLIAGSGETVDIDVGLCVPRMWKDFGIDSAGREGVTDVVHRPGREIFEIQADHRTSGSSGTQGGGEEQNGRSDGMHGDFPLQCCVIDSCPWWAQ